MIMLYYFSIAGISVGWDIPFPISVTAESAPFELDAEPERLDVRIAFSPVECLPLPPAGAVYECGHYFADNRVFYCDSPDAAPYACLTADFPAGMLRLAYLPGYESRFSNSQSVLNCVGLETILLWHRTLLLHSAFICTGDGRGILFSAPSGTGKSTQAELWKRYRSAEILNGDRAGLVKRDGCWIASGLPYAGTSGIYRNASAPLSAIVVLRQAQKNAIQRLHPAPAIRYLYPELTLHRWESDSVAQAMDLLSDLVASVPVFLLECRPDEEAVNLLDATLKEVMI